MSQPNKSELRLTTEAALRNWESDDVYLGDEVHTYLQEVRDSWDPIDITNDATDVWSLMFDEQLESESAIQSVLYGVAAQAERGAYAFIAAALGVHRDDLHSAVAEWSEDQQSLPAPISPGELMSMVATHAAERLARQETD